MYRGHTNIHAFKNWRVVLPQIIKASFVSMSLEWMRLYLRVKNSNFIIKILSCNIFLLHASFFTKKAHMYLHYILIIVWICSECSTCALCDKFISKPLKIDMLSYHDFIEVSCLVPLAILPYATCRHNFFTTFMTNFHPLFKSLVLHAHSKWNLHRHACNIRWPRGPFWSWISKVEVGGIT